MDTLLAKNFSFFLHVARSFGVKRQLACMIEESSELNQILAKILNYKYAAEFRSSTIEISNEIKYKLLDEIVDTQIMLHQMIVIFKIDKEEFDSHYAKKIDSLLWKIHENNTNN